MLASIAVLASLHLLPAPTSANLVPQCSFPVAAAGLRAPRGSDPGALELVNERWRALRIPVVRTTAAAADVTVRSNARLGPQAYHLRVDERGVRIEAADSDGAFYAWVTLSQLARKLPHGFALPCVQIDDAPALRWRILHDDISRGPLPAMHYFKERIRTIAAFKMNGYSPYIEHVLLNPRDPLPAPLDALTIDELRGLDRYARRFHVALVPQQQTLAHLHGVLQWEANATLAAIPHPPFFHIGGDEPIDLGRGQSKALVDAQGEGPVYTRAVVATADYVASKGARPMIWDDAISRHPELFSTLPKSLVFVNWHYGDEPTFAPYIKRIADAGFAQMVAPGSRNWNELYPDIDAALSNIDRFVNEGKSARVLGLFQTVWHDDGESLFEATWLPVLYAAVSAWQQSPVERDHFYADFPSAFFGVDDPRYSDDFAALARARSLLRTKNVTESSDYLFWADPFDPLLFNRVHGELDLSALRLAAEEAIAHLRVAQPPLHANAAFVMALAARRYDLLGRDLQIAAEARDLYSDAVQNAAQKKQDLAERDLFLTRYLFREQRDRMLELVPLVQRAWEYENRSSHELSVLEQYHLAAQRAIARAQAVDRAIYEQWLPSGTLPTFEIIKDAAVVREQSSSR